MVPLGVRRRSADFQSAVSPICNRQGGRRPNAPGLSDGQQNTNLRYGRLKIGSNLQSAFRNLQLDAGQVSDPFFPIGIFLLVRISIFGFRIFQITPHASRSPFPPLPRVNFKKIRTKSNQSAPFRTFPHLKTILPFIRVYQCSSVVGKKFKKSSRPTANSRFSLPIYSRGTLISRRRRRMATSGQHESETIYEHHKSKTTRQPGPPRSPGRACPPSQRQGRPAPLRHARTRNRINVGTISAPNCTTFLKRNDRSPLYQPLTTQNCTTSNVTN